MTISGTLSVRMSDFIKEIQTQPSFSKNGEVLGA